MDTNPWILGALVALLVFCWVLPMLFMRKSGKHFDAHYLKQQVKDHE